MPENPRIEELRRRVLADPASIAFAALAEEFRRVGALTDAIETCRTGLLRHPAYLSARVTLGRALIETGEYDAAREELETVLRSAPENLAAIRGLAQINERLGDSGEMDPQLAELMRQEAARVAALPPPVPVSEPVVEAPPVPEPAVEREPAPEIFVAPEPESQIAFAPEPAPEAEPDHVGSHVTSFQVSAPNSQIPASRLAPPASPLVLESEPEPEPVIAAAAELEAEPETEPDNAGFPASSFQVPAPNSQLPASRVAPPASRLAPDPGHDPQMLATLARLERFLAAVETARHA